MVFLSILACWCFSLAQALPRSTRCIAGESYSCYISVCVQIKQTKYDVFNSEL